MEKPKRNWAKQSRLTFLNSHLEPFRAAHLQSLTKGSEYLNCFANKYFKHFDWKLPLHEEPVGNPGMSNPQINTSETLDAEELERKGKVIAQIKTVGSNFSCLRPCELI